MSVLESDVEVIDTRHSSSTAIEAITKGEVDIQIRTARAFPRSITKFRRDALSMATISVDTAKSCMYAVNRGGKMLKGPSVRLAEICASAYGHLRIEAQNTADDGKFVTCRGMAWDLENNVAISTEVKRRITTKEGKRYSDDMVGTTINAGNSIAIRNAILKVIPRAYVDEVYAQVVRVAVGDARTMDAKRSDAIEVLHKMGITDDRIIASLGVAAIGDIGLDGIATLIGLINSINEDGADIDEAFPPVVKHDAKAAAQNKTDKINEKLQQQSTTQTQTPAAPIATNATPAEPAQTTAPAPSDTDPSWEVLLKVHGVTRIIEETGIAVQNQKGETLTPDLQWKKDYSGWTVQPGTPEQDQLARQMAIKSLQKAEAAETGPAASKAATKSTRPKPTNN